jgi:pimeloyl-ACP methyl ester carboxylesterase
MKRWILLRGLMRDSRHWGAFPAMLEQTLGAAEVICIDLPGNGTRCRWPSPASISELVAACRSDPLLLGRRDQFGIVAMSLGAMVATEWASQHPEEVGALVLINTSLRPFNPPWHRLRPQNYPAILRLLLRRAPDAEVERAVLAMTSRRCVDDSELLADWCRWRAAMPVSRSNVLRQLLAAARYRAPQEATVSTLLLASEGDGLVAADCSREIALQWRVPLAVHPDAGHDLPLDDPLWVLNQIRFWQAT